MRVKRAEDMTDGPINSLEFFKSHWAIWKLLGVAHERTEWKRLYMIYSVALNLIITFWYPLHLGLMLFRNATVSEDVLSMTIFTTCLACAVKYTIYAHNFEKVQQLEELLQQLDSRVHSMAERIIYGQLRAQLRRTLYAFIGIYMPVAMLGELNFLLQDERIPLFPGWFPFDSVNSTRNFYIANVYQIVGLVILLLQNYVNDCFPAVVLCLISSHIEMLLKRFEQVGVDPSVDAEAQLEACITDHKRLLQLFRTIQSFMSLPMLLQFTVTGLNVCSVLATLLFFVNEPVTMVYFSFYTTALSMQIFPTCYYGTNLEFWFDQLPYAAFKCNWLSQSRSFKRKLMLFVECSLKRTAPLAGGMVAIHVRSVFATLKFAYSLFTLLLRMRNQ